MTASPPILVLKPYIPLCDSMGSWATGKSLVLNEVIEV